MLPLSLQQITLPRWKRYYRKVRRISPANLIGYWPMWEASGSVAYDHSGQGNHGAYTGVTLGQPGIGDGRTSPLFDGVNDFNNIYSAALNADFNRDELTIACWAKVSGAGVWTDATERHLFRLCAATAVNGQAVIRRNTSNNTIIFVREDSGATKTISQAGLSTVNWFHVALTISVSQNLTAAYYAGVQVNTAAADTWTDALASNRATIGAATTTPSAVWDGTLAHGLLYNRALPASDIARLALVSTYP